jgi:ubiquinone/menaquinone biosynthesis C-methylase UbiE
VTSSPSTADPGLAAALAEEREIMDLYAPEYRRWTLTGGLVYHVERADFVRWALQLLRDAGRDPAELRFLDVGCGTGELLEELAGSGCRRLSGLDLSEVMLAEARRHVPSASFVASALEEHSLAPGSADVVMAAFTVHHLVDPRTFFRVAERVLAPGGWIFVLDYNKDGASRSGWTRYAARAFVAPLRFLARWKNRREIAAQPELPIRFNRAHELLDLDALAGMARAAGFAYHVETRGVLAPWFLHDLFESSRLDRLFLRILNRLDTSLFPRRARSYQRLAGRRAPVAAR